MARRAAAVPVVRGITRACTSDSTLNLNIRILGWVSAEAVVIVILDISTEGPASPVG